MSDFCSKNIKTKVFVDEFNFIQIVVLAGVKCDGQLTITRFGLKIGDGAQNYSDN